MTTGAFTMHRRLVLAGLAATGGLLTTAFLQVAVAAADAPSDTGTDAFTIGNYTFDPYTVSSSGTDVQGFADVSPLTSSPPLLDIGGGVALGIPLASQDFDVYNSSGTALGSITGDETVANLLGMTNTEFTVGNVTPATGETAADLPTKGSVYDVFNLGHGYENVYTATPDVTAADGTVTPGTVTDTLVTPYGDKNLSSLFAGFNDANPLQPGDAFTGLQTGDSSIGADAFSIGGNTLDPFTGSGSSAAEGFAPVDSTASVPPLLDIGGASLGNPVTGSLVHQSFDFYSGTGSSATDVGTITTGEDVTNLLGDTNTELVVTGSTAASADSTAQAADLPADGTVYDAFNLGHGYENVYTATPGSSGTVTDTLVTPYGDENLSSLFGGFNAANPLNPGDAFTGLQSGDSSIGAGAFTIDGTTFDPTSTSSTAVDGFTPVYQTIGAPPLLDIGGGTPLNGLIDLAPQTFDIYSGSGSSAVDVGSITSAETVSDLLGTTNTEFTVTKVTAASGDTSAETAALPAKGDVYDVLNLGHGYENVYTATPGTDGTVTDTLVTPFGDENLSSLFADINAANPLDPGLAFDSATTAASAIDPLSFLGL
jgi:hypothetical protein